MKLGTVIVSLLFVGSFAIILFSLSAYGQTTGSSVSNPNRRHFNTNANKLYPGNPYPPPPPPRRRNPIRDKVILKPGLCPQNYYLNGTKPGYKFFRYHEKTGACHPIDEKGPCGLNMQFYRIGNSEFGECDCIHSKRCGRPLIYWEETDSCYYANTLGPCPQGFWMVYGLTRKGVCQRNPCLQVEANSPSNHRARKFWISINGQCMKTRTRGFCPDPEQVMFFKEGEAYPQCVHQTEANQCSSSNRISRPCWAGQKYDSSGNCRQTVGLWGSEDDH